MTCIPRRAWLLAALLLLVFAAPAHAERTVISSGAVDAVAAIYEGGSLDAKVQDNRSTPPAFPDPNEVVLHVKPEAQTTVPDDPDLAFLGAPGEPLWLLPQAGGEGLLEPAWSSTGVAAGELADDELVWSLNSVEGPGPVQLYEQAPGGTPSLVFDSSDAAEDRRVQPAGQRRSYSWAFHAEGLHRLNFSVSGSRADGTASDSFITVTFFVGDLAKLPPRLLAIDGLSEQYTPGTSVTLTAAQFPQSGLADYSWRRQCPGEDTPTEVATTQSYTFTMRWQDDSCKLTVALEDENGSSLIESSPDSIYVDPGRYGPREIISRGHLDVLNVTLREGRLVVDLKDSRDQPPRYRDPAGVLLHAKQLARIAVPEGLPPSFDFLPPAGAPIWLLPEVQEGDILWPGWETVGVTSGAIVDDELFWRLLEVDGPGSLKLFVTGSDGEPVVRFDSAAGLPAVTKMTTSSHTHANWAFSAPGLYKLRFDLRGELADGGGIVASEPVVYWFYVGDLADLPPYPTNEQPQAGGTGATVAGPSPSAAVPEPGAVAPAATPVANGPNSRLRLRRTSRSLRTALRRRALQVECAADRAATCSVLVTASASAARRAGLRLRPGARSITIATGRRVLSRGGRRLVRVALTPSGRRVLRAAPAGLNTKVVLRSRFADGSEVVSPTATLRLGR